MNILRMRYFIEVAECGSFSVAAQRLYTTQPNLSKQVAALEQELGFSLFIRSHRTLSLTPSGAYLYERWKDLPSRLTDDIANASLLAQGVGNNLTIGILEGQNLNDILRSRLHQVEACYPKLQLSLERNSYSNLRSGLRSGHYDLIVTLSFDVEDAEDMVIQTLYQKVPAIVMPRSNPLSSRENLTLLALKDEPFIVISREESPGGYEKLIESCRNCGFTPNIVREPRSLESLLLCVEMGLGIAVLDQNTRLELSPYMVAIPQDAAPMGVVAAISRGDQRPMLLDILRMLTKSEQE